MLSRIRRSRLYSLETAVFLFYASVAAVMTYPAVTLVSRTYAERRDPLGVLWLMWWFKYAVSHHLATSPVSFVAVPFSLKINQYGVDPLTGYILRVGSLISTETIAYNVFLLLSFFLAAVFMYYLVKHLTTSRAAAAFSGLAFAFSPYMLTQGKEHINLVATFWIPIFVLALVKAWQRRTKGTVLWCAGAFTLLTLFNFQHGFFCGVFAATFLVTAWIAGKPWRRLKRATEGRLPIIVLGAGMVAVVTGIILFSARSLFDFKNPVSHLYMYSARPWDYFIPHAEAALFGPLTRNFITTHLHQGFLVENSLFLGYVPLFLAAVGAAGTLARGRFAPANLETADTAPREQGTPSDEPIANETRRFIWGFIVSGAVAFLFSMPPTASVLGIKWYLPSYLAFKVLPQFRAYARFGIIVTMCVMVLAGYGVAFLIRTGVLGRYKVPAVALLMGLVLLEFTIVPPFYSLNTQATTPYYRWLKSRPGKPVAAIYPMYMADDFYNYDYLFQQRIHQKKLVNGAATDSAADLYRQSILDITNPATPGLLKNLGAKYVLVLPGLYSQPVQHVNYVFPTRITESSVAPGLKEIRRFSDCYVYEITAPPADFVPIFGTGAYTPYNNPEGKFWHPCINRVVISIESKREQPATCDMKLRVMSARSTSTVAFELNGRTVSTVEAPVWPVDVLTRGVTLNPGKNTLLVKSDGKLAFLTGVPGYSDAAAAMILSDIQVEAEQ